MPDLTQRRLVSGVKRPLATTLGPDQAGLLELREILRGGGLREIQLFLDFAHAYTTVSTLTVGCRPEMLVRLAHQAQNFQTRLVCKRLEDSHFIHPSYCITILQYANISTIPKPP